MANTLEELESFHRFATRRLAGGATDSSLDELLMEWHDSRESDSIHAAIRRGLADIEAGRVEPSDVAMEQIRREFGLS